jgi:hypothetical protein
MDKNRKKENAVLLILSPLSLLSPSSFFKKTSLEEKKKG